MRLLLTLILFTLIMASTHALESQNESINIVQAMITLDPYFSLSKYYQLSFDSDQAYLDGVDYQIIEVGKKYVNYQNNILTSARKNGLGSYRNEEITELFLPFFQAVQQSGATSTSSLLRISNKNNVPSGKKSLIAKGSNPGNQLLFDSKELQFQVACGGGQNNPHICPQRAFVSTNYSSFNAVKNVLLSQGYHNTYWPGCGIAGYPCTYDFSKNQTGYSCSNGIFRKQANITQYGNVWRYSTQGTNQNPEPNPEIFNYVPPAYWWPGYVNWWHTEWVQPNGHLGC